MFCGEMYFMPTRSEASPSKHEPTSRLRKSIWTLVGAACLALSSTACSHDDTPKTHETSTTTTLPAELVITEEVCYEEYGTRDAFGGNGYIIVQLDDGTFKFVGRTSATTAELPQDLATGKNTDDILQFFCDSPMPVDTAPNSIPDIGSPVDFRSLQNSIAR